MNFPLFLIAFKLVRSISQMSPVQGRWMGSGGWDTALQKKLTSYMNGLIGLSYCHFNCNPLKMLPNRFLTSISTLLEVFSQLATCQLAPGPFEEHPCTRGHQTGHRNKLWGKQTEEEWTVK